LAQFPRIAMTLMLCTGAAKVDAVRLGWQNVRDGRITYRRQKTLRSGGELIDIRILPELAEVLDGLPRDRMTFLETRNSKSRSPDGLGNDMREWCDLAGLPECTSHGLRKAMGRRLAEAGATPHMIKAVLGHKSLAMVQLYTSETDSADLADAALAVLERPKREQTLANHPRRFAKSSGNQLKAKEN
jgi:integrase